MQTKARLAAFLVAILSVVLAGCTKEFNITQTNYNLIPIVTRVDTVGGGTCIRTYTLGVNDTTQLSSGALSVYVGDGRRFVVFQSFYPSGCAALDKFRWRSTVPTVASITRVDSISAQMTALSVGTTRIIATGERDSSVSIGVDVTVLGTTPPPPPTGTIDWNVASVCMSTVSGAPATASLTITTSAGMPVPTVTSSNTAIFTVTGPVTTNGQVTTWTLTRVGVGNGNVTATANGVTSSRPVQVLATACPGTTSTIDYSPHGGTVADSLTLTADCVVGAGDTACEPYWTSSDPSRISVRGATAKVVGGITFYVGTTATLRRIASGPAEICAQWSITRTTPAKCYHWTAP